MVFCLGNCKEKPFIGWYLMVSKFSFYIVGFFEMQLNTRTFAPWAFSIE